MRNKSAAVNVNPWRSRIVMSLCLIGIPLSIWSGYYLCSDSYNFWRHGIAKSALVISMDHRDYVYRGGTTFWYKIVIDGEESTAPFRIKLPEGKYVPILVLPEDRSKLTIGSKNSSLFEIYSYAIGGEIFGALTLIVFVFVTGYSPMLLKQIWQKRRYFFAY